MIETQEHKRLHAGDPGYGDECPDCGGRKKRDSLRCQDCANRRRSEQPNPRLGDFSEDAVYAIGRRESIITFRNTVTGQVRTLHCFGHGSKGQSEDGLARLADDEGSSEDWVVECRSTPETILDDLSGYRDSRGEWRGAR